jgi:hypothetical protein
MSDDAVPSTSADEFRAFLAEIGQTQSGFARTMIRLGDDRAKGTVARHIQRMATGEARISGEMRVIMSIFRNSARKRRKALAESVPEMTKAA